VSSIFYDSSIKCNTYVPLHTIKKKMRKKRVKVAETQEVKIKHGQRFEINWEYKERTIRLRVTI